MVKQRRDVAHNDIARCQSTYVRHCSRKRKIEILFSLSFKTTKAKHRFLFKITCPDVFARLCLMRHSSMRDKRNLHFVLKLVLVFPTTIFQWNLFLLRVVLE